jgi:NAD(P)-dependent dehydrogenase (short-subunit alcohol dehydrogenase family)
MKRQGGGHIVQISTSLVEHALQTVPAVLASLSKGAGVAATRGLAMELASSNIRVNTISLGIVVTPLHDGAGAPDGRDAWTTRTIMTGPMFLAYTQPARTPTLRARGLGAAIGHCQACHVGLANAWQEAWIDAALSARVWHYRYVFSPTLPPDLV